MSDHEEHYKEEQEETEQNQTIHVVLNYMRTPLEIHEANNPYNEENVEEEVENQKKSKSHKPSTVKEENGGVEEGVEEFAEGLAEDNGYYEGEVKAKESVFQEPPEVKPQDKKLIWFQEEDIKEFTQSEEVHISFWVHFDSLKFDKNKKHITFLGMGKTPSKKYIEFCVEELAGEKHGEKHLSVKYIEKKKVFGKLMSDLVILPHEKYFVNFSIFELDEITELKLTINAETEASVSFKDKIYKSFICTVAGSEVSSSPFKGVLSDIFFLNFSWENYNQNNFYQKYFDFDDGDRCNQIKNDQKVHRYIIHDHKKSGHPTRLLSSFKYDRNFKESMRRGELPFSPEKHNETAKFSTSAQGSMITPSQIKKARKAEVRENVEDFIEHIMNMYPQFYEKLKIVYVSRKWVFRSFYLYSPVIVSSGSSKLNFKSLHHELAHKPKENYEYPLFPIQSSFFFKILDMVAEFTLEEKKLIEDLCERCEALKFHPKYYQFFLYDRFLHYICTSEYIRPPKTKEEREKEEREKELERIRLEEAKKEPSISPEEEIYEAEEEQEDHTPQTEFNHNFYIGLQNKELFTREIENYKRMLWRYGKDHNENFQLYSIEFVHTEGRYESVTFRYLTKPSKNITWEEVDEYMSELDDIFADKIEYSEKFKFVDHQCELIPQRKKPDGAFDDNDALVMFQENEKMNTITLLISDIKHLLVKEAGGIFYSLRVDLHSGKRIRIEFNKPDIQDDEGLQIDGLRYNYYGEGEFNPRFGIGVVDRKRNFVGLGFFDHLESVVKNLVPEMNQEVPIDNFGDVLNYFGGVVKKEDEANRIDKLVFRYDKEKMLEIHAEGERKETIHDPWPKTIEDLEITDENRKEHFFNLKFYHPIVQKKLENERRKKELEAELLKEKSKKKGKKKKSKRNRKRKKEDNNKEEENQDKNSGPLMESSTSEFDVSNLASIRVDFYYGQIYKLLFTYLDESSDVIILKKRNPPPENPASVELGEAENMDDERERVKEFDRKLFVIQKGNLEGFYAKYSGDLTELRFWGAEEIVEKEEEEDNLMNEEDNPENADENEEDEQNVKIDIKDPDSDYMDNMINLEDIEAKLIFCITFYVYVSRPPPEKTRFKPELLEKVNKKKFAQERFNEAFKKVGDHIKNILPRSEVYGNHEPASQVGEFTVYSYGFGSPDKNIFFTNVDRKQAFPSLSSLYYMIIGILINYDDFSLLQRKQEEYVESLGLDFQDVLKHGEEEF